MALFQLPGADYLVRRRELALIDRLWRAWSPGFTLDSARRDELHACLKRSLPAPLEYYRAIVRPLTTFVDRMRKAEAHIATHPVAAPWQRRRLHRAAERRGPSVVRRACPRGHAEPRPLLARRGSRHDIRARRPMIGVAIRMRRVRGKART